MGKRGYANLQGRRKGGGESHSKPIKVITTTEAAQAHNVSSPPAKFLRACVLL